ncbi:hypothetical protein ILUMI_26148 [Ignelater luminosus]|uniref:Ig-like domain-containing protein n=1 Tax=Ignelater luminosus TaxID=2038154 RepID=A0A8K0C928_IGNLU|nr:hypothetical protein ILUMI_26148 [Ignelater luminosus]
MTGVRVCLFLVCFFACVSICIPAQIFNQGDYYLSDYPLFYLPDSQQDTGYVKYQKPEVIRQHSGTDMVLKCNTTSCLYHKHKIIWEFKECQPDFKRTPCSTFYEMNNKGHANKSSTWVKIPSEQIIRKRCSFNLQLHNINENHSGLYRCTEDNKTIKTYEVEVIDPLNRYSVQPPELLNIIPSNITINQSMQIIMQCKVYSKQPPVIWWFKQSDMTNYDIHYSDKYYNRINTSVLVYPVPNELNVYLSKLNIYHAREADSGIYVCVAMTEGGKDYKDAVVNVVTIPNNCEPQTSFFLLFLIPLVFVLIPTVVWLCYFRKKKKDLRHVNAHNHQDVHLTRPMISSGVASNESTFV